MTIIRNLWLRLNFLVPDPDCDTFANDLDRLVWRDVRTEPTEGQLRAVTQAQINSSNPARQRATRRISAINKLKTSANLTDAEIEALGI